MFRERSLDQDLKFDILLSPYYIYIQKVSNQKYKTSLNIVYLNTYLKLKKLDKNFKAD